MVSQAVLLLSVPRYAVSWQPCMLRVHINGLCLHHNGFRQMLHDWATSSLRMKVEGL